MYEFDYPKLIGGGTNGRRIGVQPRDQRDLFTARMSPQRYVPGQPYQVSAPYDQYRYRSIRHAVHKDVAIRFWVSDKLSDDEAEIRIAKEVVKKLKALPVP